MTEVRAVNKAPIMGRPVGRRPSCMSGFSDFKDCPSILARVEDANDLDVSRQYLITN